MRIRARVLLALLLEPERECPVQRSRLVTRERRLCLLRSECSLEGVGFCFALPQLDLHVPSIGVVPLLRPLCLFRLCGRDNSLVLPPLPVLHALLVLVLPGPDERRHVRVPFHVELVERDEERAQSLDSRLEADIDIDIARAVTVVNIVARPRRAGVHAELERADEPRDGCKRRCAASLARTCVRTTAVRS